MSERIGNCEQCGQRFGGIPDSVTALKVKCTECGGTVVIPPLPEAPAAAAPPAKTPKEAAPTAAPKEAPAKDKPLAAPLGDTKPKGNGRPDSAKPVDRGVAAPKKPEAPKVAKPIVPLKPAAKITKPIQPLKPKVKLAKPVTPIKPVVKAATPVKPIKPVAKPAAPKTVVPAPKPVAAKPAAPKPAAPKPVAPTPPPVAKRAEPAKPSAADIIAKAKAKKAAEAKAAEAKPPVAKASASDIIAKAKAKRSSESSAPKESKPSAADIIAKAKAKRDESPSPTAKPATRKVAVATGGSRNVATGGTRKRPAGAGTSRASARRREQEEEYEEKSKAPMIIVGVLVLGAAGFGAWSLMGGDAETVAAGDEVVNVPAESTGTPSNATASDNTASTTTPTVAAANPAENPSTDQGPATEEDVAATTPEAAKPVPVAVASEDFTLPAPGERINTRGVSEASRILLDQVTPLEKAADTSEDVWKEAVEDLALYLEDSGASSNRAGNRLAEDYPRAAYPAIVNAMMKVDYTTADGLYLASSLNNLIIRIGTKDLNWKAVEFDEAGSDVWNTKVTFNKKVVAAWHNQWVDTYASSLSSWNAFSNVKTEGGAVEEADTGGIVGPDDDLFD